MSGRKQLYDEEESVGELDASASSRRGEESTSYSRQFVPALGDSHRDRWPRPLQGKEFLSQSHSGGARARGGHLPGPLPLKQSQSTSSSGLSRGGGSNEAKKERDRNLKQMFRRRNRASAAQDDDASVAPSLSPSVSERAGLEWKLSKKQGSFVSKSQNRLGAKTGAHELAALLDLGEEGTREKNNVHSPGVGEQVPRFVSHKRLNSSQNWDGRGSEQPYIPQKLEEEEDDGFELMIGEIESVQMDAELRSLAKMIVASLLVLVPCIVVSEVGEDTPDFLGMSVLRWSFMLSVSLVSLPIVRFMMRSLAYVATQSDIGNKLLYQGNMLYFITALHLELALLVYSILLLLAWREIAQDELNETARQIEVYVYVKRSIASFLAFRVGWLLRNFLVLLVATRYLWKPYLLRVRSNIFAQYVMLILTDYTTKGFFKPEDEHFALQVCSQNTRWGHLSLYAVSKAISFIPRNKLGHDFFVELCGCDTLDSSREAKVLGEFLYDRMLQIGHERYTDEKAVGMSSSRTRASMSRSRVHRASIFSAVAKEVFGRPPSTEAVKAGTKSGGTSPSTAGLPPPSPVAPSAAALTTPAAMFEAATAAPAAMLQAAQRSMGYPSTPTSTVSTSPQATFEALPAGPERPGDGAWDAQEGPAEEGDAGPASPSVKDRSLVDQAIDDGDEAEAQAEEGGKTLSFNFFCPEMDERMRFRAFALFDGDNNGAITRDEMVQGVVRVFRDHKSLALTLNDSQHIARKLAQIVGGAILFILVFVILSIWGRDVETLSITFASFLVGAAFMIGPSASALVESIIFVFVMRSYDVGDRIFYWTEGTNELQNVVVHKIHLTQTEFKRWDEQVFYLPNNVMAKRDIVNIQRSGHQWHEFWVQISANTPTTKIRKLQKALESWASDNDLPGLVHKEIKFSMTDIEDSTKLTLRICFRQKSNWQDINRKWYVQDLCLCAIKENAESLKITYHLPKLPVQLDKAKHT